MSETDERPVLLVVDDDLGMQKRVRGSLDRYRGVCADSRDDGEGVHWVRRGHSMFYAINQERRERSRRRM